jgi:thiol:disulfide interchange protein
MRCLLRKVLILSFLVFTIGASAQVLNPITWKFSQKSLNDSEFVLTMQANIPNGWHIFSQFEKSSTPTAFDFAHSADYTSIDSVQEEKPVTRYEPSVKDTARFFLHQAVFTRTIAVHNHNPFTIKGNVYYQTCNDSMCLPPKQVDFSFSIPATTASSAHSGYLWIWVLGFFGGLAALFTPCVFPMIPLTVSFFTKRSTNKKKGKRNAFIYAACILLIYVLLGLIITIFFGNDALKDVASNGWVNLVFFIIFMVFGFSFLGAFEITLPSSWVNKTDSASEQGGIMGIFFMALTLCIVSFSCTAPVVGSLLVGASQNGNYWSLVVGMFGFSTALALPFALFAAFPAWLNSLPQSGGWLNSVKVVMGLLEIAFALKFLSNSDLVGLHIKWMHLHLNGPIGILRREVFVALWVVIFAVIGFYLMGKIKFHHDSDIKYISVSRLLLAVLAFSFSLYLLPGIFGAPLKLIGGLPPPSSYNEGWNLNSGTTQSGGAKTSSVEGGNTQKEIGCPLNLNCFHDYDAAVAYAKQVNKPIMIDFTGLTCTNCRNEEQDVWPEAEVFKIISNEVVLVSLYTDDKNELPEDKQYISKTSGDKVETWGEKWSDMETGKFKTNALPFYALVDFDGNELTTSRGYTPDKDQYLQFLKQGVANFHPSVFGKPAATITP